MSINFEELLSVTPDEVEAPPALPAGVYIVSPEKYELREVTTKDGPAGILAYRCVVTEPGEGVMPEDLAERGCELPVRVNYDLWLSDPYKIKKFFEAFGLDGSKQFKDLVEEVIGQEAKAYIVERPSKTDDRVFNNIKSFAPME
jgi:hypothetical protein